MAVITSRLYPPLKGKDLLTSCTIFGPSSTNQIAGLPRSRDLFTIGISQLALWYIGATGFESPMLFNQDAILFHVH